MGQNNNALKSQILELNEGAQVNGDFQNINDGEENEAMGAQGSELMTDANGWKKNNLKNRCYACIKKKLPKKC